MKFITFIHDGREQLGIIGKDPNHVVPIASLGFRATDMTDFIREIGGMVTPELRACADGAEGISINDVQLCAPIRRPRNDVICLGVNYFEHREETIRSTISYNEDGKAPIYFGKRVTLAVDPGAPIDAHTDIVKQLDYEVELAVVIGRDAYHVSRENAMEYVFGYTILNDVSARELQTRHQQWFMGKSLDGFTPIGPWIVERDDLPARGLYVRSYINGELRQNNTTDHMITDIPRAIEQLSQGITLTAGTIISMGTPSGVGMGFTPPKWMVPGDVCRCEIECLGVLENPVK